MSPPVPFEISIPQSKLDWIAQRIDAYPWFPAPEADDWRYGMQTAYLKDLCTYLRSGFDWRAMEAELNSQPHFIAEVEGLPLHFLHIRGEGDAAKRPLLITHGWPGSFYEFWAAIGPLAFPSQHGGDTANAFDLVIPSLPGYGFSGKPTSPLGQRATAKLFNTLMTDILGYDAYIAQGGDWGGLVTSWLGLDHGEACKAIHLNMIGFRPYGPPQNEPEIAWIKSVQAGMQAEGAYFQEQATKPQTLAMSVMDSPVGQIAWIVEKFHGWSDLTNGDLESVYTKDQLLTNAMIYLANDAFATSVWYYRALFEEGGAQLLEGQRCETPTAFANYPGEKVFSAPPRSWCERAYNITRWTDMPNGGHFAAMEKPDLFVEDVRAWGMEAFS